jgi:uncharacterized repeat protein (TIGR03847 family)
VARQVFSFDPPDRFVAGTVGVPGERTFYLQARGGGRVVSVALEKMQVAVLAERLGQLLDQVRRRLGEPAGAAAEGLGEDTDPLDNPVEEEFRVGTLALAWDAEAQVVTIEAHAVTEGEEEEEVPEPLSDTETGPDVLRVRIPPSAARSFVARAERVVAAGRPPCPLCGQPLDPAGHTCPRQNGHRR